MSHESSAGHQQGPRDLGIAVDGIPENVPADLAAMLRSRLTQSAVEIFTEAGIDELRLLVSRRDRIGSAPAPPRTATEDSRRSFPAMAPRHSFEQLVLPAADMADLELAADMFTHRERVFGEWGLGSIEPSPHIALNLHGPPGTGKTLAAHALAHRAGVPIVQARTSQLESKFHGEAGKHLTTLFAEAAEAGALLFIDEAESLLSRRFASVENGAEHAINILRSELIQHLDAFDGMVVFATNLVDAYDPAISSRLWHVRVGPPDRDARLRIWQRHLPAALPVSPDVNLERLAEVAGVVGRDIKAAVIHAAFVAARRSRPVIEEHDLLDALRARLAHRPETPARGDDAADRSTLADDVRRGMSPDSPEPVLGR